MSLQTALQILNLTFSDISTLSKEQQRKKIRIAWARLCMQHHPDKGGNADTFNEINAAYNLVNIELKLVNDEYRRDIEQYFIHQEITIPNTAFDLLLQENIEAAYEELSNNFLELTTEKDKNAFGKHYASFLNLAQSLHKVRDEYNKERVNYLYAQEHEALKQLLTREWRELIIRLFAEEYLDDFQYRHALASGDLWPILATRKLVSPVKCIAAILASISLFISLPIQYFLKQVSSKTAQDFMRQVHSIQQGNIDFNDLLITGLKIIGLLALITVPFYLAPTLASFAICLPVISTLLEIIACPVNKLIRPITAYTGIPGPAVASFLFAAAITLAALSPLLFPSLMAILKLLTIPLILYSLYGICRLIYNLYQINPALAAFQAFVLAVSITVSLLLPIPMDPNAAITVVTDFLTSLFCCSVLYHTNNFVENLSEGIAAKMDILPLPQETVPEIIQQATLVGNKKAAQSHRFFNTPKNAEYQEERTESQKMYNFFGGESALKTSQKWTHAHEPVVLALGAS